MKTEKQLKELIEHWKELDRFENDPIFANVVYEFEELESENTKLREALEKAKGLIEASMEEVKVSDDIWDDVINSVNEVLNSK